MAAAAGEPLRWYQIPLSSARAPPRTGLFSPRFQAGLQRYQQLRAHKQLRVGRPFALPPPGLLEAAAAAAAPPPQPPRRPREPPPAPRPRRRRRRRHHTGPERGEAPGGSAAAAEAVLGPLQELLLAGDGARSPAPLQGAHRGPRRAAGPVRGEHPLVPCLQSHPQAQRPRPLADGPDLLADGADPMAVVRDLVPGGPDPVVNDPDPLAGGPDVLADSPDPLAIVQDPLANGPDSLANSLDPLASSPDPLTNSPDPLASSPDPMPNGLDPLAIGWDSLSSSPDPVTSGLGPLANSPDPLPSGLDPLVRGLDVLANSLDSVASSPDLLANSPDRLANSTDPLDCSQDLLACSPDALANSLESPASSPDPAGTHMDLLAGLPAPLASSSDSVAASPDVPGGCPATLANSLEALLAERRGQREATVLPGSPDWASADGSSGSTGSAGSADEKVPLSEEHRLFLAHFATMPALLPAVHPGEPVFCVRPPPAPTLDARGLRPRSALERLFLCALPTRQAALVREGHVALLYRCVPACPLPVLRWLFQMTAVCPDTANAARALWDITVHRLSTAGHFWCPTVPEISQAFCRLGADLGALHRQGLLPLELCPAGRRPLERVPAASAPVLATQLGDICKFLALCVVAQPDCYPDRARLALLTLLCFLALDHVLRCQPLPDLQLLLHCLLEGIGDWQQQLPDLCLSLCQLSQHHHNLVAIVRLLPDVSDRGRELRRRLGLCAMARLLGEPLGTVLPGRARAELRALGHLLALVQPGTLQRLVLAGCQREPDDPDWEACYLSHSLLLLASAVVGAERPSREQRGHVQQLCAQLDRQLGAGLREGSSLLFRTQLKGLAALTYVKWQELLAQSPPRAPAPAAHPGPVSPGARGQSPKRAWSRPAMAQ